MSEGRRTQVVLLDERRVELLVQPKLLASDLLDLVASYFNLKEKDYFGLAFLDETTHFNWLQLDKKVLEHDFHHTKSGILTLHFRVQFFTESINQLRDSITIELFYLQAKESVFKGDIEADSETVFELGAYVLQATEGDYTSDQKAHRVLKKLPVLPQYTLQEHPSLAYCEERILFYYKRLGGLRAGQCIVCYMQLAEGLPTYGVHYYDVKDKGGIPWWLGLSFKGVCQYDRVDRVTPRKVFQWRQLQNIFYRDRKFSIEVTDPQSGRVVHTLSSFNLYRDALEEPEECFDDLSDAISDPTTQVSVSRRTFGVSNATVHAWYGHPTLIRSMWTMAVNQHQFYLDRKHNKDRYASMQRSFTQIANELAKSTNSLTSSQASEVSSDPGQPQQAPTTADESSDSVGVKEKEKENTSRELLAIEGETAKKDMVLALKARKSALNDRLREKLEELQKLCISESELTGELPLEYPRKPGEPLPKIKKRVATAFTLSAKVVNAGDTTCSKETQHLNQLEGELEIQSKITIAARKLADDPTISKKVRKTRRESYKRSAQKLDGIERRLLEMKKDMGMLPAEERPSPDPQIHSHTLPRKRSVPSTPPLLRSFAKHDRGRSKKKEDKSSRVRSKSVPRQLFENAWRSPSLGRRKDKVILRPASPIEIYTDSGPAADAEVQNKEAPKQNLHQQSRTPVCYETSLQSMATLDINHQSDANSLRDDSSTHSAGSTRSQPEDYVSHSRTCVDHGSRLTQNRQSNFPTSGDVHVGTNQRTSPHRSKPPIQRRIDRGPPPPYNSPAKLKSLSQSGRYFESPEDTLGRTDIDTPKLRQHASSMHDLQYALQSSNLPMWSDDDVGHHQQVMSLSQPPSPKKHASLGNLAIKSNSLPGSELDEQEFADYSSQRNYKHRIQYHKYMNQESIPRQRDVANNYYPSQTLSNRNRNGSGDTHIPHDRNYASLDRPHRHFERDYASLDRLGKSRLDRDRRPSGDILSNDSMYHSVDRRNPVVVGEQPGLDNSSYASLDRPLHKPPLPSGSIDDVSMSSLSRRRHNSFSSQRSNSSYSSQGSSSLSNHQASHPRPPLHHTSSNSSGRQSEYSVYTSLASLSPSNSFSSNGAGSSSQNSSFQEPQPASMYTTSTPTHLQPRTQPAYGTNIAISKAHYTPAQPMTCEPVSRANRPSQTSSRNLPRSYTPHIEEGSYRGDAGESLADGFNDEMLSWLDDHEGIQKEGTLV